MNSDTRAEFDELVSRYEKWRAIYFRTGQSVPNEPEWSRDRLHFRAGYPHDGWTAYVVEPKDAGYQVLRVTTERRGEPTEGLLAFFSDAADAGKYIIWKAAVGVRVALRLPSVNQAWRAEGLDSRVKQTSLDTYVSKFELKGDPSRYCILQAGGIQPENRLLPLTYDELDTVLMDGMPHSATAQV